LGITWLVPPGPRNLIIPLVCVLWACCLAATIDAARKPASAFRRAHRSKWFWVVTLPSGPLAPVVGAVWAIIWFVSIRPGVVAAMRAAENRHSHTRKAKGRSVH
jgi:hypothetical protein